MADDEAAAKGSDFAAWILGKKFCLGESGSAPCGLSKDPARGRYWLKKAVDDDECEFAHLSESGKANATRLLRELDAAE